MWWDSHGDLGQADERRGQEAIQHDEPEQEQEERRPAVLGRANYDLDNLPPGAFGPGGVQGIASLVFKDKQAVAWKGALRRDFTTLDEDRGLYRFVP